MRVGQPAPQWGMTDIRHAVRSDLLDTVSARHGGLIPASALLDSGFTSHAVEALVRGGSLVRARRAVYVPSEAWRSAGPDERHRIFVLATAAVADRQVVVSFPSAAAMHGLPLRAATATFLTEVVMIDRALRVDQERVANAARSGILLPAALTKARFFAELADVNPRHGARQTDRAIEFGNGPSANGGESLSRVRIFQLGFEVPELQVPFLNVDVSDYWVDCYWRWIRKIGEFDEKHEYTRGRVRAGRDPGDFVWCEKHREDALRRQPDSFDRWDWDTAFSPSLFARFLSEHGVPRA